MLLLTRRLCFTFTYIQQLTSAGCAKEILHDCSKRVESYSDSSCADANFAAAAADCRLTTSTGGGGALGSGAGEDSKNPC